LCECQEFENLNIFKIDETINKIDYIISDLLKNIPELFLKGCFFSNVDKRIQHFFKSEKLFCWIHGGTGTGKTYSLYAYLIYQIVNSLKNYLKIIKEVNFNYKIELNDNIAIDDVGISEQANRNINLSDLYYELIDYKLERKQKLIFTSNVDIDTWLKNMQKVNSLNSDRIRSRLQNNLVCINLTGIDQRKGSE